MLDMLPPAYIYKMSRNFLLIILIHKLCCEEVINIVSISLNSLSELLIIIYIKKYLKIYYYDNIQV